MNNFILFIHNDNSLYKENEKDYNFYAATSLANNSATLISEISSVEFPEIYNTYK